MLENLKIALFSSFIGIVTALVATVLAYFTADIFDLAEYIPLMVVIYYFVAVAGIVFVAVEMLDNV
jgi:hypothetical protein